MLEYKSEKLNLVTSHTGKRRVDAKSYARFVRQQGMFSRSAVVKKFALVPIAGGVGYWPAKLSNRAHRGVTSHPSLYSYKYLIP